MDRKRIWRALTFLGLICLLLSGNSTFAKEVKLEELSISLYSKPVTGFQVILDRTENFVSRQIISHVSAINTKPAFQYQHSIIFEDVRYSPISTERDISLYFMLKSLQGQYTELTLVAMYDYRRSINSSEFPELSQNLKIDMAQLVRHVTGDVMVSDGVHYDDATLAQLRTNPNTKEESKDSPVLSHYKEEEVDNASVLLYRDPFKGQNGGAEANTESAGGDTTIERLTKRIQELEQREQVLLASERNLRNEQSNLQRQQELLLEKVKTNKALKDSVVILNQRVEALLGQNYVSDDVSVSSETAYEMAAMEKENKRLLRSQERLSKENDSLRIVAQKYSEQLNRLAAGGQSNAEEMVKMSEENKALRKELQEAKTRMAFHNEGIEAKTADSLLQVLAEANIRNASQKQDIEKLARENGRLKEDNDFLSGKKMQLEERIVSLDAEVKSLRDGSALVTAPTDNHQIDSLNGIIRIERRLNADTKAEIARVRLELEKNAEAQALQDKQLSTAKEEKAELEKRVAQLERDQNANTKTAPTASSSTLRDSLTLVKQQLFLANNRIFELSNGQHALSEAQAQLQIKDLSLKKLKTEYEEINQQLYDSQKRNENLQSALNSAREDLSNQQKARNGNKEEADRLQQKVNNLQGEIQQLNSNLANVNSEKDALKDNLRASAVVQANQDKEIQTLKKDLSQKEDDLKKAQAELESAREKDKSQTATISILQNRLDSLNRLQIPEGDQQKFIRDQWAKLQQWEKDLEARNQSVEDREKLIKQREQFFATKESDFAVREAKVKDLEAKEKRLALLEQQLNSRAGTEIADNAKINVREGRVVEFGQQVQVFIAESPLSPKNVQKQIILYMLSRDELYDDKFPDLVYRSASLSELDSEPIEWKIRIDSKGTGSILQISAKLSTGEFLGLDNYRERIEPTKQLITRMLRYKL